MKFLKVENLGLVKGVMDQVFTDTKILYLKNSSIVCILF
ncbi:hypothetical protein SB48_HM08orf06340 [Heyndrickxia coagulans]|uniref:Uncharacterized protein n=1 Tax=Heyndrickxia coagulans TaxID=1398 RepID=A0AAN0TAH6_HEYCO|nr:hypothetical protein SB48_HM08orf06340 [Heyndrickxia coagulans]